MRYGSGHQRAAAKPHAQLLNQMVGTKFKAVRGYRGSSDITLAMERGEVDGFVGWC